MKQSVTTKVMTKCGIGRAAEILGMSQAAVYMRIQRRQVPYRKLGRRIYFFEEELAAFLDQQPGMRLDEAIAAERG